MEKRALLSLSVFTAVGLVSACLYIFSDHVKSIPIVASQLQDEDRDLKKLIPPSASEKYRQALSKILLPYLDLSKVLADDDQKKAFDDWMVCSSKAGELNQLDGKDLDEGRRKEWIEAREVIMKCFPFSTNEKSSLSTLRRDFARFSGAITQAIKKFGHAESGSLYVVYCSMAFENKGAYWLQKDKDVKNPYFGKEMLKCGMAKEKILPPAKPKK